VQTALAHALGLATRDRRGTDLPALVEPILARQADGRIAPSECLAAYWACSTKTGCPDCAERRSEANATGFSKTAKVTTQPAQPLDDALIQKVLATLATSPQARGEPVYVRNGEVVRVGWSEVRARTFRPIGGRSRMMCGRPASRLRTWLHGCHDGGAAIYFGNTGLNDSLGAAGSEMDGCCSAATMWASRSSWAQAFKFRPAFKCFGFHLRQPDRAGSRQAAARRPRPAPTMPDAPPVCGSQREFARLSAVARVVALAGTRSARPRLRLELARSRVGRLTLLVHMAGAGLFTGRVTATAVLWSSPAVFVSGGRGRAGHGVVLAGAGRFRWS